MAGPTLRGRGEEKERGKRRRRWNAVAKIISMLHPERRYTRVNIVLGLSPESKLGLKPVRKSTQGGKLLNSLKEPRPSRSTGGNLSTSLSLSLSSLFSPFSRFVRRVIARVPFSRDRVDDYYPCYFWSVVLGSKSQTATVFIKYASYLEQKTKFWLVGGDFESFNSLVWSLSEFSFPWFSIRVISLIRTVSIEEFSVINFENFGLFTFVQFPRVISPRFLYNFFWIV